MPKWVSVQSRLPEIGERRLVYCGEDYRGLPLYVVAEHEGGNSWARDDSDIVDCEVTHWTCLPEPPTEPTPDA